MQPDWAEHAVSIVIIAGSVIALLVAIAAGLARQVFKQLLDAINQLTDAIGKLFGKFEDHEHRLSVLEGSHKTRTEMKLSCKVDE
jgi:hypothetical protein